MATVVVLRIGVDTASLIVQYDDVAHTLRAIASNPMARPVTVAVEGTNATGILTVRPGFSLNQIYQTSVTLPLAPRRIDGVLVPVLSGNAWIREG